MHAGKILKDPYKRRVTNDTSMIITHDAIVITVDIDTHTHIYIYIYNLIVHAGLEAIVIRLVRSHSQVAP